MFLASRLSPRVNARQLLYWYVVLLLSENREGIVHLLPHALAAHIGNRQIRKRGRKIGMTKPSLHSPRTHSTLVMKRCKRPAELMQFPAVADRAITAGQTVFVHALSTVQASA